MQKMQIIYLAKQSEIESLGKSATACTIGDKFLFCGDPSWARLNQLQVLLSFVPWHKVAVAYTASAGMSKLKPDKHTDHARFCADSDSGI